MDLDLPFRIIRGRLRHPGRWYLCRSPVWAALSNCSVAALAALNVPNLTITSATDVTATAPNPEYAATSCAANSCSVSATSPANRADTPIRHQPGPNLNHISASQQIAPPLIQTFLKRQTKMLHSIEC